MIKLEISYHERPILEAISKMKSSVLWKGFNIFPKLKIEGEHGVYKVYIGVKKLQLRDTYEITLVIPPLGLDVTKEVYGEQCETPYEQDVILCRMFHELADKVYKNPYA